MKKIIKLSDSGHFLKLCWDCYFEILMDLTVHTFDGSFDGLKVDITSS